MLSFLLGLSVVLGSRLRGHLHQGWQGELTATKAIGSEPLIVSDVLAEHGPAAAKAASRVYLDGVEDESYAGFLTVNKTFDSNMFYWYFPAQSGNKSAPLLIWLQGGPGGSSLFGLFSEMGPYTLTKDLKALPREVTWNKEYAMLFIDNPIGAGFSYTKDDKGYCTDEFCVADNLYKLITEFYQVYPEELANDLYITGESYGGHYVPAFAYKVHQMAGSGTDIRLKGIAVGDGWIDPVEMIPAYPDMMYNMGLIDRNQREVVEQYCFKTVEYIRKGQMYEAFTEWDQFLNGDVFPYHNYFHNQTGSNDYDNFLNTNAPAEFGYFGPYVNQPDVRAAIHVGNQPFQDGHQCELHLLSDFMVSMKPRLQVLLDAPQQYKILIYSGQLDVIIGAALTERFLPTVQWSGQQAYHKAERMVWRISDSDPNVAGFARQVKNLQQVIVVGAGHIAPYDQPERVMNMIDRLVKDIPYKNLPDPA
mmetsp:Transcript_33997/g.66978  ORF Transcript_33997/g.66978 Transcript_33997/m.66978 type:complete len:476 (+) Transcript_33997:48-1475(+)|eukprot:CAMPEP_0175141536 /NCGR_PEP_ID=MMETSP0087-20121206/12197_1 /TAXON_ID=136419 /ORGANISM="Unknown Unknown, Strain D1" /LENGTH=475 /DNA_ID=CAMNT_0016425037 /DNA_START=48 /DNA_END=1475 /DNA_ORIENTATION=-